MDESQSINQSEMEDDDDKVIFHKIGKTEIAIDKVLMNLLAEDVTWSSLISLALHNFKEHYSAGGAWYIVLRWGG